MIMDVIQLFKTAHTTLDLRDLLTSNSQLSLTTIRSTFAQLKVEPQETSQETVMSEMSTEVPIFQCCKSVSRNLMLEFNVIRDKDMTPIK